MNLTREQRKDLIERLIIQDALSANRASLVIVTLEEFLKEIPDKSFSEQVSAFSEEECGLEDPHFDGSDYDKEQDQERLKGQMLKVFTYMLHGEYRRLQRISDATGAPQSSVSAQLRNLRKKRFGGHTIKKKRMSGGLWLYRLIPNEDSLTFKNVDKSFTDELPF